MRSEAHADNGFDLPDGSDPPPRGRQCFGAVGHPEAQHLVKHVRGHAEVVQHASGDQGVADIADDAGPRGASLGDGMSYGVDDVACEGIRIPAPQRDQRPDPRVE